MPGDPATADKAALRLHYRRVRASAEDRERVDAAVVAGVLALPEVGVARFVMLYWPLVARGEVDVRPLADALVARGVTVGLPVMVPGAGPSLDVRRYESAEALAVGPFGILKPPADAERLDPERLVVVVVPALALGRDGSRLGYGGGYYDAFLATTAALRVGVAPHACLAESLPAEAHDARLDVLVTERETVRVETPGTPSGAAGPRNAGSDGP